MNHANHIANTRRHHAASTEPAARTHAFQPDSIYPTLCIRCGWDQHHTNHTARPIRPQYFTPQLHANLEKLMKTDNTRQQIAARIAFVFVACENIADFAANRPSPAHMDEWIKGLIDNAKAIRHLAAQLNTPPPTPDTDKQYDQRRREEWQGNAGPSEEKEQEQDKHAAALQGARPSSVDEFGDDNEVGERILRAAADHLYNLQTKPMYEHADAGDAAAVDLMDDIRANRASSVDMVERYKGTFEGTITEAAKEAGRVILQRAADYIYNNTPRDAGDDIATDVMDALREGDEDEAKQLIARLEYDRRS